MADNPLSKYGAHHPKLVRELALLGKADREISELLGIDRSTLQHWDEVHPEFREARLAGKDFADAKVAASLYQRALGYEVEEDVISTYEGKVTVTKLKKRYPPDFQSASFWLASRHGDTWKFKNSTQQLGKDGNPIDPVVPVVNLTIARE